MGKRSKLEKFSRLFSVLIAHLIPVCCFALPLQNTVTDRTDSLLVQGSRLLDGYDYEGALGKFRLVLRMRDEIEDPLKIATAFNGIGEVYHDLYLYDTALACFDSALVTTRISDDKYLEAVILNNITRSKFAKGEYEEALVHCDSALAIATALQDDGIRGSILWTMAHIYTYSGRVDTGFVVIDSALAIARSVGDRKEEARALLAIGRFCNFTNESDRGLAYCDSAIALARTTGDLRIESRSLSIKGLFYCQLSQYDQAIECLDSSLVIDRKTIGHGHVRTYLSLQWAHRALTHWDYAVALCDSALGVARRLQDKREISTCLLYRAATFLDFGQFDAAISNYDSAYAIAEEINDTENMAYIRGSLGECFLQRKQYEQALEHFTSAHTGALIINDEFLETGAKICIGLSYCGLNDQTPALACLDSALVLARKINVVHYVAWCYQGIGSVYFRGGDYDKALAYYDSAYVTFKGFKYKSGQAMMLDHLGQVYEKLGDREKAIDHYKASIEIRESIRKGFKKEDLERSYVEVQRDVYERLINVLIDLERYEEAFEYMERSRSQKLRRTLEDQGIIAFDPSLRRILERIDRLETEIQGLGVRLSRKQISNKDFTANLNELEGRRNQALVDLKIYHPDLYNVMMPQIVSLEYIQEHLPKDAALIEYMLAGDSYVIFLFSQNRFVFRQVKHDSQVVDSIVLQTLNDLRWFASKEVIDKNLAALHNILLEPVNEEISTFAEIVIIPYGILHYLPFHALRRETVEGNATYLVEQKKISYLPSAVFLTDLEQVKIQPKKELLAFANCDGTLPNAEIEVDSICRIYPDACICKGDSATKERLIGCCGDYRMLHLATHGILNADPRFSYVVLAPPEQGNLTVREIMGLYGSFVHTALVTLSACETAVEEDFSAAGTELTTLSNAFKVAGVPSVVATLWEIADRSTAVLMKNFYENLKTKRMDKMECLRKAQLALLDHPQYSHPYYWAPFVLIGDWR
ncbi:MAG: CHAT domain-containing protein [candidate division WOR-3 bacterium]|nr:MAG: CHAT domain-containing protein [candidate division WOR-3 bacterium]